MEFCVRAIHHSKQRAIVLGGFAHLSQELLETTNVEPEIVQYGKENILFVPMAPHEWLFPQVAATVHHGGAGTITAALRGGVPTIITPVFGDQFDHAYVMNKRGLGVGFRKQLQKIGWKELGDAIQRVVSDPGMAQRAKEVGERILKEDGASNTADFVESFWKNYCVTGKFDEAWPGTLEATESVYPSMRSVLTVGAVVAGIAAGAAISYHRR